MGVGGHRRPVGSAKVDIEVARFLEPDARDIVPVLVLDGVQNIIEIPPDLGDIEGGESVPGP